MYAYRIEDLWTVFLGDQERGWAFPPVPFCTLWLLLIVKISDHEHPSTRAASGDRPQACGQGPRDPPGVEWEGRGAGPAGSSRWPSGAGPDPQLTVRVGVGSRWTGRRTRGVPRSRPGGSGRHRASCGDREGVSSPDGEGTPFSMTMPRRRVQRRRNQRFIGSS